MIISRSLILFFCVWLLCACQGNEVYSHFNNVEVKGWKSDHGVSFLIDLLNVAPHAQYKIDLDILNSATYPYEDVWLSVTHNLTDTIFTTDTLQFILSEDGSWLGSGSAGIYHLSFPYKTITFDSIRARMIQIRHLMKHDPLPGINKIGVIIKPVD